MAVLTVSYAFDQLTWKVASLCVWRCVQRMRASPLPGLRYVRCMERRELQELERM